MKGVSENKTEMKETETQKAIEAESVLLKQQVPYWDWLRCKGTTPSVYNAILAAMEEYAAKADEEKEKRVRELEEALRELLECDYTSGTHLYEAQVKAKQLLNNQTKKR